MTHAYLGHIGTAVPDFAYPQNTLFEDMARRLPLTPKQEKALRGLYKHSGINTRHSVLADFDTKQGQEEPPLYPYEEDFPLLSKRMERYQQEALPLALKAIQDMGCSDLSGITHILAVSCTGLAAPGLDLMLLKALGLPAHTHRTCVHYMGCYAALHALKQADSICRADPESQVLVVCVELCTLHFQEDTSWDHLTSSLLFADGAAAVVMSGEPQSEPLSQKGQLQMDGFYSEVALDGWDEMAWNLDEKGFLMRLGRGVPFMLQDASQALICKALDKCGLDVQDIKEWAIHPGGRLILDLIVKEIDLAKDALWASRSVLADYGNMSSPTVLFVLKRIQEKLYQQRTKAPVFAAAFGPGLTMETAVLSWLP